MERNAKALTDQFYAWEIRGRGVLLAENPSDLEPPFHQFFFHNVTRPYIDDGKRPTLLSNLVETITGRKEQTVNIPSYEEPPIEPYIFEDTELHAFTIILPKSYKTPYEQTIQLLIMLSHCQMPVSFEIAATESSISIHMVCRIEDSQFIRGQCKAYLPEVVLQDNIAYLEDGLPTGTLTGIVDFSLAEEFMRPIRTAKGFDLDPYLGFFGIIEHLQDDERLLLQIQFAATKNSWAKSIITAVSDGQGGCFFLDAPDMLQLAKDKVTAPLYAVSVKLAVQSEDEGRIFHLLDMVGSSITTLSRSPHNGLITRQDAEYSFDSHFQDMLERQTHRLGMLLNVYELATLVHFPSHSIHSDKLLRSVTRTKAAPTSAQGHQYVLGRNVHQNKEVTVSISEKQRMRHMHIIGATGTGKSNLLLNLIYQDIINGNGCAILDPHGDVIETILTLIPANRKNDVVIIDPYDSDYPVRCNMLHAQTDLEKELISSDLVALFRRFSSSWGDQMNSVFANAILAFVESTKGGTLVDLQHFLIDKSFRESFLQTVQDPQIVYYWQKEYPLLKSSSIGPILTRLDTFLRPKVIRNMVSQKESLPIAEFMDTKKIVLIKLSRGLIGAENSHLLGALLVSKIHQGAMVRQLQAKDTRVPFCLYIDEFHHFVTPSMSEILSGARQYGLGLVLAHQSMEQVSKYDSEIAEAILTNAGTRICFRLGNADAKKMETGFSFFTADDLQNVSTGEAIVRINRAEDDFSLQVQHRSFPANLPVDRDDIQRQSRQKYATRIGILKGEILPIEAHEPIFQPASEQPYIEHAQDTKETNKRPPKEKAVVSNVQDVEEKRKLSEHRYLQTMIKKMGEAQGYKALLEVPTKGGGKVDVVLEKEKVKIACEISVSTDVTWELHNIEKSAVGSYTYILSISKSEKFSETMRQKIIEVYGKKSQERIKAMTIEGFAVFFNLISTSVIQNTETINGYRVKKEYGVGGKNEQQYKKDLLNSILKNSKR